MAPSKFEVTIPPSLAEIASGSDHVDTNGYGKAIKHASQSIRKEYCLKGEAYGIKPIKVGNRLLWPVAEIAKLLNGGEV